VHPSHRGGAPCGEGGISCSDSVCTCDSASSASDGTNAHAGTNATDGLCAFDNCNSHSNVGGACSSSSSHSPVGGQWYIYCYFVRRLPHIKPLHYMISAHAGTNATDGLCAFMIYDKLCLYDINLVDTCNNVKKNLHM
jgi:hypothetical protein